MIEQHGLKYLIPGRGLGHGLVRSEVECSYMSKIITNYIQSAIIG